MRHPFVLITTWLVASTAMAALYEVPIYIDDEEDLVTMQARDDISEATLETLRELLITGVDLNSGTPTELYDLPSFTQATVDALLEYRKLKGRIEDPAELVGAGVITEDQLMQIAPFIRIDDAGARLPVGGRIRAVTGYTVGDTVAPPAVLTARVRAPYGLSFGGMLIGTRLRAGVPTGDPLRGALVADQGYLVNVPRAWAQWKSGAVKVVVGSFHIGFGERLTLDNTRRYTPNGIYVTEDFRRQPNLQSACKVSGVGAEDYCAEDRYVTADFQWREAFRGVAASIEDIALGEQTRMSVYGFGSYQSRSLYQYELYNKDTCDDPLSTSSSCSAPPVFLRTPDEFSETRLSYSTLTGVFDEVTAGGRVQLKPTSRFSVGVTGYGANTIFRQQGVSLDFQEWSRYPRGGPYGAIGIDATAVAGDFSFGAEFTRSFNSTPGGNGGGFAVLERNVWSIKKHEVELSFRFYDLNFANPYARPISSPDEYLGQRARNEAGTRLTYTGRFLDDWAFRARANFWVLPYTTTEGPAGTANMWLLLRADFTGWRSVKPSVWVDFRNKNLASFRHGGCTDDYAVTPEFDPDFANTETEPYDCSGDFYRAAARVFFSPAGKYFSAGAQAWVTWRDDPKYTDRFRQDLQAFLELRSQPTDWLLLRVRSRYLNQDISSNTYLEDSLWTFVQANFIVSKNLNIGVRYDLYTWLDARESTVGRIPNPEHRFLLDLRAGF